MPRIVRCALIQASNAAPPEASLDDTKHAMIEKHLGMIRAGGGSRRADRLPAGNLLRPLFLRGADHQLV